jgi:hypothetical protein
MALGCVAVGFDVLVGFYCIDNFFVIQCNAFVDTFVCFSVNWSTVMF